MYILRAVGGTFSDTHDNTGTSRSFVRRFFDRFSGGDKVFFEGPASAWSLGRSTPNGPTGYPWS